MVIGRPAILGRRTFLGLDLSDSGDEILFQGFIFGYRICNGQPFETPSRTSFAVKCDPFVIPIDRWIVFS